MKRIILALALIASIMTGIASSGIGAYSNLGYKAISATDTTSWTGAAATNITIVTGAGASYLLHLNPDRDDDGVPIFIGASTTMELTGIYFYGFIMQRAAGDAEIYWW
jgi:hypothetical protein